MGGENCPSDAVPSYGSSGAAPRRWRVAGHHLYAFHHDQRHGEATVAHGGIHRVVWGHVQLQLRSRHDEPAHCEAALRPVLAVRRSTRLESVMRWERAWLHPHPHAGCVLPHARVAVRFLHTRAHAAIAAQLKYQQPSLSSEFCGPFVHHLLDLSSKAVKALDLRAGVAAATATEWPASNAGLAAHLVYGLRTWSSTVVPEALYVPFARPKCGSNVVRLTSLAAMSATPTSLPQAAPHPDRLQRSRAGPCRRGVCARLVQGLVAAQLRGHIRGTRQNWHSAHVP